MEPDSDSCDFDEAHEVGEELVVSGRNPSELLELVEEALDAVSFLVELAVVRTLDLAIALGRDDDPGAAFSDPVGQVVGVISLVGDGSFCLDAVDQVMGESDVVALAG